MSKSESGLFISVADGLLAASSKFNSRIRIFLNIGALCAAILALIACFIVPKKIS